MQFPFRGDELFAYARDQCEQYDSDVGHLPPVSYFLTLASCRTFGYRNQFVLPVPLIRVSGVSIRVVYKYWSVRSFSIQKIMMSLQPFSIQGRPDHVVELLLS